MKQATDTATLVPIDVDAEPEADELPPSDSHRITRLGLWVIGIGFGGFLIWAAFAPLDEGVPAAGTVSVDTKRKAVQHLQGGIVRDVLVREGQTVQAGDVVIRLDDAVARANYQSSRQRYLSLRAVESRLTAEQLGLSTIDFHRDLLEAARTDPQVKQQVTVQNQLLQSRRASLAASLGAIDEGIAQQRALIEGYRGVLVSRKNQEALYEREAKGVRDLVAEGYAPATKQLELERSIADVAAAKADVQASFARAHGAILELQQRANVVRSEFRKEVDSHLADTHRDVQAEAERFKAVSEELARTEIRAPAAGQVVGLAVQTVGGVIQAGQKLMDVVPHDERLVIETRVPPNLIDRVQLGAKVDVRFAVFANSPQLVADGILDSVSADILVDPSAPSAPYYLARVSITPEGAKTLGKRQLQPGMPVEVVIKTGERSLLTYLLHPFFKRIAASMKEE
jgi:protease secretion system membrane fusion protein